jgi:hypothetical protein
LAKDEHRDPADLDDTSESSHAADEPTAVWDMEALRKAGLGELVNLPETGDTAPATPAEGMQQRASIIVDEPGAPAAAAAPASGDASAEVTPPAKQPPRALPAADPSPSDSSWWRLVAMALALGVAAYLALRFLR